MLTQLEQKTTSNDLIYRVRSADGNQQFFYSDGRVVDDANPYDLKNYQGYTMQDLSTSDLNTLLASKGQTNYGELANSTKDANLPNFEGETELSTPPVTPTNTRSRTRQEQPGEDMGLTPEQNTQYKSLVNVGADPKTAYEAAKLVSTGTQGQQTPISSYLGPSIVDYLSSIGRPSDFASRKVLAQQMGIQNYTGTASQNTQMLNSLRGGQPGGNNTGALTYQSAPKPPVTDPKTGQQKDPLQSILEKYGVSVPDPTDTPITQFAKTYKDLLNQLGVPSIKKEFDSVQKQYDALQNELNDKKADINDDPWLSEGVRLSRIKKLEERYEGKISILTEKLNLYDSLYQRGIQEAQWVSGQINQEMTRNQNLAFKVIDIVQKELESEAKLNDINPANFKEVQGGLYDVESDRWVIPPQAKGDYKPPTSYQEWQLAGKPGTYESWLRNQKTPTAAQETVATYAARLEQANPILTSLTSNVSKMNPLLYEAQVRLPGYGQTSEMQQYMQAARNFINATLRRESGAVISDSEFDTARKQYLPAPGDSAATLNQKAQNRQVVYKSFVNSAGGAYQSVESLLGNSADPLGIR